MVCVSVCLCVRVCVCAYVHVCIIMLHPCMNSKLLHLWELHGTRRVRLVIIINALVLDFGQTVLGRTAVACECVHTGRLVSRQPMTVQSIQTYTVLVEVAGSQSTRLYVIAPTVIHKAFGAPVARVL